MNNIPWDEIMKRLDAIAAKLTQGAVAVWGVLVRQVVIDGCIWLAWALFWAIFAVAMFKIARKIFVYRQTNLSKLGEESFPIAIGVVGTGLIGVAMTAAVINCLSEALPRIINPGYYALMNLISQIK